VSSGATDFWSHRAFEEAYFVLRHNKSNNNLSRTLKLSILTVGLPTMHDIVVTGLKVKCSGGGPHAVTFASVTATVLLNGVGSMKCQLSFVG